jgi:hypothetical protein
LIWTAGVAGSEVAGLDGGAAGGGPPALTLDAGTIAPGC